MFTYVGFETLTSVIMNFAIFDITPFSQYVSRRFGEK
jgi:hypothetical protein